MTFLLIPLMSFLARAAGADWFGLKILSGVLFGAVFGLTAYHVYGHWVAGLVGFLISWRGFEFGHGTFYKMDGYNRAAHPRKQTIEYIVEPFFNLFKIDKHQASYSWVCMGTKGLLIGAAAGWYGVLLAIIWPFAYWVGHRVEKQPEVAEWISGMFAGVVVVMAIG